MIQVSDNDRVIRAIAWLMLGILGGLMLDAIGNCRPGNYITIGDYFGRNSEMAPLHVEKPTNKAITCRSETSANFR